MKTLVLTEISLCGDFLFEPVVIAVDDDYTLTDNKIKELYLDHFNGDEDKNDLTPQEIDDMFVICDRNCIKISNDGKLANIMLEEQLFHFMVI